VALCLRSRAKIQREQVKIMPPKRGTAESKLPIDEKCLHGTLGACKPTHARCRRGSELTPVQAASKGCCVQRPCRVQPQRRAQRSHPSARWCNGGFAWANAPALRRASEGTLTSGRRKLHRAAALGGRPYEEGVVRPGAGKLSWCITAMHRAVPLARTPTAARHTPRATTAQSETWRGAPGATPLAPGAASAGAARPASRRLWCLHVSAGNGMAYYVQSNKKPEARAVSRAPRPAAPALHTPARAPPAAPATRAADPRARVTRAGAAAGGEGGLGAGAPRRAGRRPHRRAPRLPRHRHVPPAPPRRYPCPPFKKSDTPWG